MDTPAIKRGDVVVLKSGGPRMTVGAIESAGPFPVTCFYFAGNELKSVLLEREHLEAATEPEKDGGPVPPPTVQSLMADLARAMREKCCGRVLPRAVAVDWRGHLLSMCELIDESTIP